MITTESRPRQISQPKAGLAAVLVLAALHGLLGLVLHNVSTLSFIHAIFSVLLGIWFIISDRSPERVLMVAFYITGAEVLWRMTDAGIFHEYGKYASSLLLILATLKWKRNFSLLPALYFIFLIPSIINTLFLLDPDPARQEISANLSGPFALMVAATFFYRFKLDKSQLLKLMEWLIYPVISIAVITLYSTITAEEIFFSDNSNFITSGGFGPNQVSAILGLGAMCSWIIVLFHEQKGWKFLFAGVFIWLTAQSILTFSRGGTFNLAFAILPLTLIMYKRVFRNFINLLLVLAVAGIIFLGVVPRLNLYTQGALEQRYTELDLTNRELLMQGDLNAFLDHPLFGVGPGMATEYYERIIGVASASHTEYTRALAEHGLLGILSLAILVFLLIRAFTINRSWVQKGLVLCFSIWSLVEMSHAAMRVEAISLLIGLSTCLFIMEENGKPAADAPN